MTTGERHGRLNARRPGGGGRPTSGGASSMGDLQGRPWVVRVRVGRDLTTTDYYSETNYGPFADEGEADAFAPPTPPLGERQLVERWPLLAPS